MRTSIEDIISPDEKILWKGRRNEKILNFYLFSGLAITLIIAFFFFTYGSVEHHLGSENITDGKAISALAIFIGFFTSFAFYYNKAASKYIITDKKVIVQHGLSSRTINYAYFERITHTFAESGIIGSFFNVGKVYIDSGKVTKEKMRRTEIRGLNMNPENPQIIYYIIKDVENPKKVHNLIERMIEKSKEPKPHESLNEIIKSA